MPTRRTESLEHNPRHTFMGAGVPVGGQPDSTMHLQPSGTYIDLDTFVGPF